MNKMLTTSQVRDALRDVADPISGEDIVSGGMISDILIDEGHVSFAIEVSADQGDGAEPVRKAAEQAITSLDGVDDATVVLTAKAPAVTDEENAAARRKDLDTQSAKTDALVKPNTDPFMMDGHKMFWHLDRMAAFQRGERIAPLHIDVGLSKGCNIACHYCYGVTQGNFFLEGAKKVFPRDALLRYMQDAGDLGVRSIALIGEAEPTLNPALYDAIRVGKGAGVDMAIGTNGVLWDTKQDGEEALERLTFIRFNISAATEEGYQRVHNSKAFKKVIQKIKWCVDTKRRNNLDVTIGLQMVLTPEDADQAVPLAELGAQLGVDYFVIKQCSDTVENDLGIYDQLETYDDFTDILLEAETHSADGYNVIVKWKKILNHGHREYDNCLGAPFLLYSSGDGKIFPCGMWFDNRSDEFMLGDLVETSFKEMIEGDQYWNAIKRQQCDVDVHKECYANCRTHMINDFVWKVREEPPHVNFV